MEIKDGDIVLCALRFNETEERKLRPCLVLSTDAVSCLLVCITSKKLDKAYDHEVVLSENESLAIGLKARSKLDFMKRDRVPIHEIRKELGHISALPKARLAECFRAAKAAHLFD